MSKSGLQPKSRHENNKDELNLTENLSKMAGPPHMLCSPIHWRGGVDCRCANRTRSSPTAQQCM